MSHDPSDPSGRRFPGPLPAPAAPPAHGSPPAPPAPPYPPEAYPPPPPGAQAMVPYPQAPPPQPYPGGQPNPAYPAHGYPPPGYPPPYAQQIHIVVQNAPPQAVYGQGLVRVGNRNRVAAAVLAFLFGAFGIHKFYLGRPIAGLLYLLFFWTFIPYFLGLVDFVLLLAMSDHEFELKYNTALELPRLPGP